jgi:hypothetical protein
MQGKYIEVIGKPDEFFEVWDIYSIPKEQVTFFLVYSQKLKKWGWLESTVCIPATLGFDSKPG